MVRDDATLVQRVRLIKRRVDNTVARADDVEHGLRSPVRTCFLDRAGVEGAKRRSELEVRAAVGDH